LGASGCTGLGMAAAQGDRKVSNGCGLSFTGTVGHHGAEAVAVREVDGVEGFGQGTNLVDLDQQRVGCLFVDAALQAGWVGGKEVVADDLQIGRASCREGWLYERGDVVR